MIFGDEEMSDDRKLEPFRLRLIGIVVMVYLLASDSVNADLNEKVLSDFNVPVTYESVMGAYHSFKEAEVGYWLELNKRVQPEKSADGGVHGTVVLPNRRVESAGEHLHNSHQRQVKW